MKRFYFKLEKPVLASDSGCIFVVFIFSRIVYSYIVPLLAAMKRFVDGLCSALLVAEKISDQFL